MTASEIHDASSLQVVLALLKENNLPYQDIVLEGNLFVAYGDMHHEICGAGGLELYDEYSLLRSVVVAGNYRGKNSGQAIVADLLERAKKRSVKKVYLLTETAHDFFIKLGFKDITREAVPERVKNSSEFTSVCPVSAACMELEM